MAHEISALGTFGILREALGVYVKHFWLILAVTMIVYLPINLAAYALMFPTEKHGRQHPATAATRDEKPDLMKMMQRWSPMLALAGIACIVYPLMTGAVVWTLALKRLDRPATLSMSYGRAWKMLWKLLVTQALASIYVFLGFLLLIIPGIYLALKYSFATQSQVVIIEGKRFGQALTRSGELMKNNYWTAIALGILLFAITYLPMTLAEFLPFQASLVFGTIWGGLLLGYGIAVGVTFYFSARHRLENFDLARLAAEVDTSAVG